MNNLHIVSSGYRSGKSSFMIALSYWLYKKSIDFNLFKAVSITDDVNHIKNYTIPWSLHEQLKVSGVSYDLKMNPILLVPTVLETPQDELLTGMIYKLFLNGEYTMHISGDEFLRHIGDYKNMVIAAANEFSNTKILVSEGMGNGFLCGRLAFLSNWEFVDARKTKTILIINASGNNALENLVLALKKYQEQKIHIISAIITKGEKGGVTENKMNATIRENGIHMIGNLPYSHAAAGYLSNYSDWIEYVFENVGEGFFDYSTSHLYSK